MKNTKRVTGDLSKYIRVPEVSEIRAWFDKVIAKIIRCIFDSRRSDSNKKDAIGTVTHDDKRLNDVDIYR